MALVEKAGQEWRRKHDDPRTVPAAVANRTIYPRSLEELIEICSTHAPSERIHAAGSHWSLSEAAISDSVFVETHDPDNVEQAMGRTLYEVVPGCLNPDFVTALAKLKVRPFDTSAINVAENHGLYPIHIETGKRVYQLYSELDAGDGDDNRSLAYLLNKSGNSDFLGPWAFKTLGAAGGQTVFGALATGTHGGDFCFANNLATTPPADEPFPPIADSVMALHLVADGGRHYWIEPKTLKEVITFNGNRLVLPPLTDDAALTALYDQSLYGGPGNFTVERDDALFNSVLISAGRFGIVYSIVIAAVRQYSLHEERRLTDWQKIKSQVTVTLDPNGKPLYSDLYTTVSANGHNRYLQINLSVTPHDNFTRNLASVTKRWNVILAAKAGASEPAGRLERRGTKGDFDQLIQAPRFEFAGNSRSYGTPTRDFLGNACSNADFMDGVIETAKAEFENFVNSNGATVGKFMRLVLADPTGLSAAAALALASTLLIIAAAILPFLAALLLLVRAQGTPLRLGDVFELLRSVLLDPSLSPEQRQGGILAWQVIAHMVFSGTQKDNDVEAISYAVMDGHDYLGQSCQTSVDSIEIFFDATDQRLITYVDQLLRYEVGQEVGEVPRAFVGYISLRFTGPTAALLGQQQFPVTCAIEVSGLRDVAGVTELMNYARALALNGNYNCNLHWGQRNDGLMRDRVQQRFGDTFAGRSGNLHQWRDCLSYITDNGRLDGFSSVFTQRTGLEIVTPIIGSLTAAASVQSQPITVVWDCGRNPPNTEVALTLTGPSGALPVAAVPPLPLVGQRQFQATESGVYVVSLVAAIELGGERREVLRQVNVTIA